MSEVTFDDELDARGLNCPMPLVKARKQIGSLDPGKVLKIVVQYPQGWLIHPIEREGQQQAAWRTDPKQSGAAGCMGDIGLTPRTWPSTSPG